MNSTNRANLNTSDLRGTIRGTKSSKKERNQTRTSASKVSFAKKVEEFKFDRAAPVNVALYMKYELPKTLEKLRAITSELQINRDDFLQICNGQFSDISLVAMATNHMKIHDAASRDLIILTKDVIDHLVGQKKPIYGVLKALHDFVLIGNAKRSDLDRATFSLILEDLFVKSCDPEIASTGEALKYFGLAKKLAVNVGPMEKERRMDAMKRFYVTNCEDLYAIKLNKISEILNELEFDGSNEMATYIWDLAGCHQGNS